VGDERPTGGFETKPERRRGILPALIALSSLVTLGAVLGLAVSLENRGDDAAPPPDNVTRPDLALSLREALLSVVHTADNGPTVAIRPTGEGPCVNDATQTCQNSYLVFRNIPLEQRETAIRRGLRSLGFVYEGSFERAASHATGGVGLMFRRGQETVAVYLQPDAVTNACSALHPLIGINPSCADIISESS
jgi:hypothetical protein